MDKFLLNTFKHTLAEYIIGFHPEQVNAKLLVGKGEIVNLNLNVDTINTIINSYITKSVRLKSAQITKLSFNVTSFTNLKKAPIIVTIDEINIILEEPLDYEPFKKKDPSNVKSTPKRKYGLVEKIIDNITVVINRVNVNFQPLGKFKTKRRGDWTPPQLCFRLSGLRFELTDEFGIPGSPEVVWRNSRVKLVDGNVRTWMVYKKCFMDVSVGLNTSSDPGGMTHTFIENCHVEVHMALKRRLKDSGLLAVQIDVSVTDVDVKINCDDIPIISHAAAGVQYCLIKDRHFEDPLKSDEQEPVPNQLDAQIEVTDDSGVIDSDIEKLKDIPEIESNLELDDDEEEDYDIVSYDVIDESNDDETSVPQSTGGVVKSPRKVRPQLLLNQTNEGAIVTIQGIPILDNVTMTLSLRKCNVRASYGNKEKEYFDIVLRGLIVELILQKEREQKKGYFQLSLACITVHNTHNDITYPILMGGFQQIQNMNYVDPDETIPIFKNTVSSDESFPWFINRSVRDDPLELRFSYPVQAIGLKTSINMDNNSEDPFLAHELGLNNIEIILHSDPIYHAVCLLLRNDSRFSPRWHSGDWIDSISPNIIKAKLDASNLHDHIQPLPPPSNVVDFFSNATIQGHNIYAKVPAAILEDLSNSDIIISLEELMIIASMALPRDFLDGKVTGYTDKYQNLDQDDESKDMDVNIPGIEFPNEVTDLCYDERLGECKGDKPNDQEKPKIQVTFAALSIEAKPILPLLKARQPKKLLSLKQTVLSFSMDLFENIEGDIIFVSSLVRGLSMNVDFELITTVLGTTSYHAGVINKTLETMTAISTTLPKEKDETSKSNAMQKIEKMNLILCLHVRKTDINFWTQNIPLTNAKKTSCVLPLCKFEVEGLEIGLESRANYYNSLVESINSMKQSKSVAAKRYFLLKCFVSSALVQFCDSRYCAPTEKEDDNGNSITENLGTRNELATIFSLGEKISEDDLKTYLVTESDFSQLGKHSSPGFSMRIETWDSDIACSARVDRVILNLNVSAIESMINLMVECLLLPELTSAFVENSSTRGEKNMLNLFPEGSLGAKFEAIMVKTKQTKENTKLIQQKSTLKSEFKLNGNILLKITARNVLVIFPEVRQLASITDGDANPADFCSILKSLHFSVAHFSSAPESKVAFDKGTANPWKEELSNASRGFHIVFDSRQCFNLYDSETKEGKKNNSITTIVPYFGLEGRINPSDARIGFQDSNSICANILLIERFGKTLLSFKDRAEALQKKWGNFFSFNSTESTDGKFKQIPKEGHAMIATANARSFLKKIIRLTASNEIFFQSTVTSKQKELDNARTKLFQKERQRVALLSILSHNCSGWMAIADEITYGQRVQNTAMLTKYWVVLRHSLLIVFLAPGMLTPREIIPIDGAVLRLMTVGRRNIDEKRGFVLSLPEGRERILVVASASEQKKWTNCLLKATATSQISLHQTLDSSPTHIVEETSTKSNSGTATPNGNKTNESNVSSTEESMSGSNEEKVDQSSNLSQVEKEDLKTSHPNIDNKQRGMEGVDSNGKSMEEDSNAASNSPNLIIDTQENDSNANETSLEQKKESFSSVKALSNVKFSKLGASFRSSTHKSSENVTSVATSSSESQDMSQDANTQSTELLGETDTINEGAIDDNQRYNDEAHTSQSSSQTRRVKMLGKMSSINVNAKLSMIGSAVKSARHESETLKRLGNVKFQGSKMFSNSKSLNEVQTMASSSEPKSENEAITSMTASTSSMEEYQSDVEFDTIDLDSSDQDLLPSESNVDAHPTASRREQLRKKIGKVPSISMNNRLSKISAAVKSARPNADALKHLNSDSFQSSSTTVHSKLSLGNWNRGKDNLADDFPKEGESLNKHTVASADDIESIAPPQEQKATTDTAPKNSEDLNSDGDTELVAIRIEDQTEIAHSEEDKVEAESSIVNESNSLENSTNRREQLRKKIGIVPSINMNSRLSKIGSAVKSVRPNADALKHLNSDKFQSSSSSFSSKLSIGSSTLRSTSKSNSNDKIKLKEMNMSDPILTPIDNLVDDNDEELEPVSGSWIVTVTVRSNFVRSKLSDGDESSCTSDLTKSENKSNESLAVDVERIETQRIEKPIFIDNFLFEVKTVCCEPELHKTKVLQKTFADIVALHASVSEEVTRVVSKYNNDAQSIKSDHRNNDESEASTLTTELGLKPLHQIRFTGRLLQGLMDASPQLKDNVSINNYRGEILAEFLNSCLQSSLPRSARMAVSNFLDIEDKEKASTCEEHTSTSKETEVSDEEVNKINESSATDTIKKIDVKSQTKEIFALASACELELVKEHPQDDFESTASSKDIAMPHHQQNPSFIAVQSKAEPSFKKARYPIQNAVMVAMTERDEICAQMIANDVLHHHQLHHNRKQTENLQLRCKSFEKHIDGGAAASNAFVFGVKEQQRKIDNAMIQDTDVELLELCKQLASEISGRTSASLELIRLKESHALDLEIERNERAKLEDEVQKLQNEMKEEKRKKDEAQNDMMYWKKLYEDLTKSK